MSTSKEGSKHYHPIVQLLKELALPHKGFLLIGAGSLITLLVVAQSLGLFAANGLSYTTAIFTIGLVAGYLVGGLGLAWGAVLVPSLLLMNINPTIAIQSSLLLQILIAPLAGLFHLRFGNIDKRILIHLTITGIIGASVGAFTSASLPEFWLTLLTGVTTFSMGLLVLLKFPSLNGSNGEEEYRKVRITHVVLIGTMAGFAAGAFGTGWGPISVSALILAGMVPRLAVGSSLLARAFVAISGSAVYLALGSFQPNILLPLLLGGGVAVILGAQSNRKLGNGPIRTVIGIIVLLLGLLTTLKVIL